MGADADRPRFSAWGIGSRFCVRALLLGMLVCVLFGVDIAYAWDGYVMRVETGGIIVVSKSKDLKEPGVVVRLYGVDAPLEGQPFAAEAQQFLRDALPRGSGVEIQEVHRDSKGLIRAMVQRRGKTINYELLAEGLGWVNRQQCKAIFCRRWYVQEHYAVQERRGLWSVPMATPPWQWTGEEVEKLIRK